MIPQIYVEQWRLHAPWQTLAMIEQDLMLSRTLVELFNHPKIKSSLAFRGGTALNKLYIQPPARYSEDRAWLMLNRSFRFLIIIASITRRILHVRCLNKVWL